MRTSPLMASMALLSACAPTTPPPAATAAIGCPALDSRNWHAWIDRMPGPNSSLTLNIVGQVDMPTPGYSVTLAQGPADRMMPPGLRFRLQAEAPDGVVPQVIAPTEVQYRAATPYPKIREIIIGCGDSTLVTIPDVMITD